MKNIFSKSLALLLAVGCVLSFSSCEIENWFDVNEVLGVTSPNDKEPELDKDAFVELYAEWQTKIQDHENVILSAIYEALEDDVPMMSVLNYIEYDGEKRHSLTRTFESGETITQERWFADGWIYKSYDGVNQKAETTIERFDNDFQIFNGGMVDDSIINMPSAWFEDFTWAKNDVDRWCATIVVSKDAYVESFPEGMFVEVLESGVIDELNYEISLSKEGDIERVAAVFEATQNGSSATAVFVVDVLSLGDITVKLPEGAAEWQIEGSINLPDNTPENGEQGSDNTPENTPENSEDGGEDLPENGNDNNPDFSVE